MEKLARGCVMTNYTLKIFHSFYLANTFSDLLRHIYMSSDSHMKIYLQRGSLGLILPPEIAKLIKQLQLILRFSLKSHLLSTHECIVLI